MILFAGWVGSVSRFIDAIAAASDALPDGWHLRVKEHPSAKVPFTAQIEAAIASGARIVLDNQTDSFAQIAAAQAVLTVNSSMGLQAMLFEKPVITTGACFYALPGVTHQADSLDTLRAALGDAPNLDFDPDLRGRFLTWLATRYYIPKTADGFDLDRIAARLAGDL